MPAPDLTSPRAKNIALALLVLTQFMVVIDSSITNVALPSIGQGLTMSQDNLSWIINSYTLTFGGLLLLGGRLADFLGRRRIFVVGMALFAIASLLCGLAQNQEWLITARAVQGIGAALASPAALSIITTTFSEGAERNRALGLWGAVAGAGGAAGVLLGGILTEWAGWEWIFYVNVPVAALIVWQAPRRLLESTSEDEDERTLDLPGAVSVTAGLALLVYALVEATDAGWTSSATILRLLGALALLAAFVIIELRTRRPLVPFSIFRNRTLRGANVVQLLIGAALFSMFYFITLYLQEVLGYSAMKTGLAYLPLTLGVIISAGAAGQITTRIGFKPVLLTGLLLLTGGLAWFTRISTADGSFLGDILGPSILVGVGLGLSFVPVTIAAMVGAGRDEAGLASGLINTSQQVGGALGLAVLASIANSKTNDALHAGIDHALALTQGFSDAFAVGAGIAIGAAVLAAFLIATRDSRTHVSTNQPTDEPATRAS